MKPKLNVDKLVSRVRDCAVFRNAGHLVSARGILTATLTAAVGELCYVFTGHGQPVLAEVVGFSSGLSQLMPLQSTASLTAGATVVGLNRQMMVPVGPSMQGRVIDALGQPIDHAAPLIFEDWIPLQSASPDPMTRRPIAEPFVTGQKCIDGMLTIGAGQRMGLFAGSGVGKSTLLGEIARHAQSDVNVVVLVGERGREVRPFIEECLGTRGLERSIVIVSTAEQPPLVRIRSAQTALTIADWFRQRGKHVLFMADSLTRLAWSQRELGLSIGEPPSSRGFTPSAIQLLANLIEQLGTSDRGMITGILTVLVDGDDTSEPVADAARSMLDGHIVLDRKLAEKGHFPAIDVLASISRVANQVTDAAQQQRVLLMREILGEYREVEDLIRIGAYQPGTSPVVDQAVRLKPELDRFLRQASGQSVAWKQTMSMIDTLAARVNSAAPLPQS
ncbi:MAG: FliI/YscN family ATPase [Pirellulaceae bacterium]